MPLSKMCQNILLERLSLRLLMLLSHVGAIVTWPIVKEFLSNRGIGEPYEDATVSGHHGMGSSLNIDVCWNHMMELDIQFRTIKL